MALYFKAFAEFPLVVAANRDEHYDRPSLPPSIINAAPAILAGKDLRGGGTWLGINDYGLVVGILNRRQKDGPPAPDEYRSRGLLSLDLLRLKDVMSVREMFRSIRGAAYQPFTVVCADRNSACAAYNVGSKVDVVNLGDGLHVFSNNADVNTESEKVTRVYAQFCKVPHVDNGRLSVSDYVGALAGVLGDHSLGVGSNDHRDAICVHGDVSGTVSSSIIFYSEAERRFQTYYCAGTPCRNPFIEYPALYLR